MANLQIKRVYEKRSPADGRCILVDRVWPRGISKEKLGEVIRWEQFRTRYFAELDRNSAVEQLRTVCERGPVTLLYSARDVEHNQAQVLSEYLATHR